MSLEHFIGGLILIQVVFDLIIMHKIKQGVPAFSDTTELKGSWVGINFFGCIVTGFVYSIIVNFYNPLIDVNGENVTFLLFVIVGSGIWILNSIILAVVCNTLLENYTEYRQGCISLGLDLKEYVNKYFVQKKLSPYIKDNERSIKLYRVVETHCFLGTFAKIKYVTELGVKDQLECNKKEIKKMVKTYFDSKNTYLIDDSRKLKKIENKSIEVITLCD